MLINLSLFCHAQTNTTEAVFDTAYYYDIMDVTHYFYEFHDSKNNKIEFVEISNVPFDFVPIQFGLLSNTTTSAFGDGFGEINASLKNKLFRVSYENGQYMNGDFEKTECRFIKDAKEIMMGNSVVYEDKYIVVRSINQADYIASKAFVSNMYDTSRLIKTINHVLVLPLATGKNVVYKETPCEAVGPEYFTVYEHIGDFKDFFVVQTGCYESSSFIFVSKATGAEFTFNELPVLSPDGSVLFTFVNSLFGLSWSDPNYKIYSAIGANIVMLCEKDLSSGSFQISEVGEWKSTNELYAVLYMDSAEKYCVITFK
ncbi:MAG: hypothetical protein A2W93_06395 [Bacteroidetes bacterium GWF2_43_63]|nr:MAG: hypothetical protein A2W94_08140 [Bacteroidetes bacterium GWE2_42_42]OFY53250.1 MAG: hypothetical protein A2W93_06395 [Bacteroidetes bacterium GWF2_43_63]HBG71758.1 hypothetical protein [Bacteroidales bacterium]HCB61577.1 hypothetical protein [Bacteroidales bacterium]HCY22789.1 hypothetical protein [Bacteroidales bacterium]